MTTKWKNGFPQDLLRDLRPGGWCYGSSPRMPRHIRLHKTEITSDLKKMAPDFVVIWRIAGDPDATGRYSKSRRTIVIWLGN